jgi:methyl-accepting chemotaxis protein
MGIVATISDKSSASVQAVLSNADNQQNRVNSMVTSIEALTDLTKTLDQLIN